MKMSNLRFDERVILISGAARGLGETYSRYLSSLGGTVVLLDREDAVTSVADEINDSGGMAHGVTGDVTSPEEMTTIVDDVINKYGRIDVLINNAGIGFEKPFIESTVEEVKRVMDVHFHGTANLTRAVWKSMERARYGRILNITSAGTFGLENWATYSAAKAAVLSFGRALAQEGADSGIVVNMLAPTALTPMLVENIQDQTILDAVTAADPSLVAPVAAYLVHETVPFTGRSFYTGAGLTGEIQLGMTRGVLDRHLTIEKVAQHLTGDDIGKDFQLFRTTVEHSVAAAV